jgi:hypothetical protein
MVYQTENYQNLGLVRRPNFRMQEINFLTIYDNNITKIHNIPFNQSRYLLLQSKSNDFPFQHQSDKVTVFNNV